MEDITDRAGVAAWLAEHGETRRTMTTNRRTTDRDPSVPRKLFNGREINCWGSAVANLTASEELPIDDPAQLVLLARALVYATLEVAGPAR